MKNKILIVASAGGHWTQILRLIPAFDECQVSFVSTKNDFANMVTGYDYYCIPDSNRWNKVSLVKSFYAIYKIISINKPNVIITTGAAPGLMAVIAGRMFGIRSLWIDSIANVEKLSLSGKIASKFADKVFTQWPNLANGKIVYYGNILST